MLRGGSQPDWATIRKGCGRLAGRRCPRRAGRHGHGRPSARGQRHRRPAHVELQGVPVVHGRHLDHDRGVAAVLQRHLTRPAAPPPEPSAAGSRVVVGPDRDGAVGERCGLRVLVRRGHQPERRHPGGHIGPARRRESDPSRALGLGHQVQRRRVDVRPLGGLAQDLHDVLVDDQPGVVHGDLAADAVARLDGQLPLGRFTVSPTSLAPLRRGPVAPQPGPRASFTTGTASVARSSPDHSREGATVAVLAKRGAVLVPAPALPADDHAEEHTVDGVRSVRVIWIERGGPSATCAELLTTVPPGSAWPARTRSTGVSPIAPRLWSPGRWACGRLPHRRPPLAPRRGAARRGRPSRAPSRRDRSNSGRTGGGPAALGGRGVPAGENSSRPRPATGPIWEPWRSIRRSGSASSRRCRHSGARTTPPSS